MRQLRAQYAQYARTLGHTYASGTQSYTPAQHMRTAGCSSPSSRTRTVRAHARKVGLGAAAVFGFSRTSGRPRSGAPAGSSACTHLQAHRAHRHIGHAGACSTCVRVRGNVCHRRAHAHAACGAHVGATPVATARAAACAGKSHVLALVGAAHSGQGAHRRHREPVRAHGLVAQPAGTHVHEHDHTCSIIR